VVGWRGEGVEGMQARVGTLFLDDGTCWRCQSKLNRWS